MSSGDRAKIRHALDDGLNPAVFSSLSPLGVPLLLKPRAYHGLVQVIPRSVGTAIARE